MFPKREKTGKRVPAARSRNCPDGGNIFIYMIYMLFSLLLFIMYK